MGSNVYIEQPRYIAHVEAPACHLASVEEGPRFVAEVTGPASFAVVARGIVMLPGASSISDIEGLAEALASKQPAGSYAAVSHGHAIGDVTGLGEALAGKQPAGSYAAVSHGHAISDVTGLGEALGEKQNIILPLETTARLALPATLPVGQRDVLVWDTIWQCYFRYVEAAATWQQVSVPRHDNTTMNSLSGSAEPGYRVFNTSNQLNYYFTTAWLPELPTAYGWRRTGGDLSILANTWTSVIAWNNIKSGDYIISCAIGFYSLGNAIYYVRVLVNNIVVNLKEQQRVPLEAGRATISDIIARTIPDQATVEIQIQASQSNSFMSFSSSAAMWEVHLL